MNPFEAYARKATSQRPAALVGPVKTRAELRLAYDERVKSLAACKTVDEVDVWEAREAPFIAQLRAEHEFFWTGKADFLGLEREIERAKVRVDVGLDYPRYDEKELGL